MVGEWRASLLRLPSSRRSTTELDELPEDSYYIGSRILSTRALFRTFCCRKTGWGGFRRISTGRHGHCEMQRTSVSTHMVPPAMRTLVRRNVQVSGEKEPTKRVNSFTNPKYSVPLSSVKGAYLSLYFFWRSPYILPCRQLPPSVESTSTYIYPNLKCVLVPPLGVSAILPLEANEGFFWLKRVSAGTTRRTTSSSSISRPSGSSGSIFEIRCRSHTSSKASKNLVIFSFASFFPPMSPSA
jgi:hypothetical protein